MRLLLPLAALAGLATSAMLAGPGPVEQLALDVVWCHPGTEFFPSGPFARMPRGTLGFAAPASKGPLKRLPGFGTGGFAITTKSSEAQAWFDYGMKLAHAFYHRPAVEAFHEATRLDAECAMCAWGEAWAMGPTINFRVSAADMRAARSLSEKASRLAERTTDKERALATALALRYAHDDGPAADAKAFAEAMTKLAAAAPNDNELAVLAADANMIHGGHNNDTASLERAKAILEGVLARAPDDTGAIHFYIHVTEWLSQAQLALPYAKRLAALAPAGGHLVHMPSHTYIRVGLFKDAAQANVDAVAADEAYGAARGYASAPRDVDYHLHNVHFGTIAAIAAGDGPSAIALADKLLAVRWASPGAWAQIATSAAYFAYGRLGEPAAALSLGEPARDAPVLRAMWHYARGEAHARAHDVEGINAEAASMKALLDAPPASIASSDWAMGFVRLAHLVLVGRAAMIEERWADAARAYREAADLEDADIVGEGHDPPVFWYPVRRSLALALLHLGRTGEAEAAARRVLTGVEASGKDGWPDEPLTLLVLSRIQMSSDPKAAENSLAAARAGWKGDLSAIDWSLL